MIEEPLLERYGACWTKTIELMRRPYLFVPFIVIMAAKTIPLLLVFWFWHPLFSPFMAPIIKSLGGDAILHYPEHILSLPDVYRLIEIVIMVVIGFAMLGWSVFMMVDAFHGRRYRGVKYGGEVSLLIPPILIIGFVFVFLSLGTPVLFGWLAGQTDRPKLETLLFGFGQAAGLVAEVFLIYSLFFLRKVKGNAVGAMRASVAFARGNLGITSLLVVTSALMFKPLGAVAGDAGAFVTRLQGGLVPFFLVLETVVEILANFFLIASTTWVAMTSTAKD